MVGRQTILVDRKTGDRKRGDRKTGDRKTCDRLQEDGRQEDRPQEDRQQEAVLMIRMDPDPHVFGPHGSVSPRYGSRSGSGPGSFSFLIKVLSRLKKCLQNKILAKN